MSILKNCLLCISQDINTFWMSCLTIFIWSWSRAASCFTASSSLITLQQYILIHATYSTRYWNIWWKYSYVYFKYLGKIKLCKNRGTVFFLHCSVPHCDNCPYNSLDMHVYAYIFNVPILKILIEICKINIEFFIPCGFRELELN